MRSPSPSPRGAAAHAQTLAVAHPGRDVDLELAAVDRQAPRAAGGGLLERQLEHRLLIGAAACPAAAGAEAVEDARATATAAEQIAEELAEVRAVEVAAELDAHAVTEPAARACPAAAALPAAAKTSSQPGAPETSWPAFQFAPSWS